MKMEIEIHQLPKSLKIRQDNLINIVRKVADEIQLEAGCVSFIFVDDSFLADMHARYLNDPSKTDVITFDLGEETIEGEIYMSYDRAVEQARSFKVTREEEITRLMIHGLLHLAGYDDQAEAQRVKMKALENKLLDKYFSAAEL
jgi:rRNA maturation RNase YbeY